MKRLWLVLFVLFLAAPVAAQQSVVAQVKAELQARGVNLSGECGAFEIVKRVAWVLRSQGAGLVAKPGGSNCQGYSTDLIQFAPPAGHWVDILQDAGGLNNPQWGDSGVGDGSVWRPAIDPGDSPAPVPVPVPTPQPVPQPPIDWSGVYQAIHAEVQRLYDQNERMFDADAQSQAQQTQILSTQIAAVDQRLEKHDNEPNWLTRRLTDSRTYIGLAGLLGGYVLNRQMNNEPTPPGAK